MPLPLFIGLGVLGVGGLVKLAGKSEIDDAKEKFDEVNIRNENNVAYLESCQTETMQALDVLGKHEAEILKSFQEFADIFEKIHNRPKFKEIKIKDVTLPEFTPKQLTDAAASASTLLANAVGSGFCLGFFAVTGGLTLMPIATASFAPALLISGIIDIYKSTKLQDKADKAWNQMLENEEKINSICEYLVRLEKVALRFDEALCKVNGVYQNHLSQLEEIVDDKCDYENFTHEEKLILENTVLLVGLLYEMCKVKLTKKSENDLNEIKEYAINKQIVRSMSVIQQIEAPKFCSECGAQSQIESTDKDVFEYSEEDGEIILTGLKDTSLTEIVIPNFFTIIGAQAFRGCSDLKSVVIPDSVTKIRAGAFEYCTSLMNVVIPNSVKTIRGSTFFFCKSLTSIMLPDSVMEIGDYAFSECRGLKSIVIPNSVTVIKKSAFSKCKNLTDIVIPNSVRQIETAAFSGCTKLKGVVIPKSIRKIGDKAFSNCASLTNIVIPNPDTKISENAFDDSTEIVYM